MSDISREWLKAKIDTDPDLETEAGAPPSATDIEHALVRAALDEWQRRYHLAVYERDVAIQSLPKVTAERDELLELHDMVSDANEILTRRMIVLEDERDALSAQVRDLKGMLLKVREACLIADDDQISVTTDPHIDEDMFDRICQLVKDDTHGQ